MSESREVGPITTELAAELASVVPQSERKEFAIMIFIALIGLAIEVYQCLRTRDAIARLKNPTPGDISLLEKIIKRKLGVWKNFLWGGKIKRKLLEMAANATPEKLTKLLQEQGVK
jgi:hypothetical protein